MFYAAGLLRHVIIGRHEQVTTSELAGGSDNSSLGKTCCPAEHGQAV